MPTPDKPATASTAHPDTAHSLGLERRYTVEGVDPYDAIDWEIRTALIGSPEQPVFEQPGVEFPASWSQNATNIVAQKYFAYGLGDANREYSVKQMIDRVAEKIATEGEKAGYFGEGECEIFAAELRHILVNQMASFNSPVWFNIGVEGAPQTSSACFILSVEDTLRSIGTWYTEEMRIFQAGSGAGVNLSRLRASGERLSRGGASSGPVTFMRAADASAGTIQSGGVTRRAAKMVILDADHPDIEDFVTVKSREEERIRALAKAGFDMGFGPTGERNLAESTAYQNANQSVRVTDEFMRAVEADAEWELKGRRDNSVNRKVRARELLRLIADAAWKCADPGLQYETTIADWHTTPGQGPISASNPCSEYLSNDNSACNLASLNLLKFLRPDGSFDVESFRHTARIVFLAQEITISFADFPTQKIAKNTRELRQIGIGYANLGALLMALGLPYDSDEGRAYAAAVTALLTGESYLASSEIARKVGPFAHYSENAESMQRVLGMHRDAAAKLRERGTKAREIVLAARESWQGAVDNCAQGGIRNAQASVLAPTGTISFMMDCDTTGIEPDFALVKHKTLVGGGSMVIANRTIPQALKVLGYSPEQIEEIVGYVSEPIDKGDGVKVPRGEMVGAPHLAEEHLAVFDCALGERSIAPMGHVKMMAAAQPFLSGAISKTVNLPETATVEDILEVYMEGWKGGLKALAVYRDGSKHSQPLADKKTDRDPEAEKATEERLTSLLGDGLLRGERREIPRETEVVGVNFTLGQVGGYVHVRLFDDGTPGAVFVDVGQAGSTLHGFIRAWAVTMSLALQHGTPLDMIISKLAWTQFEPAGFTDDPDIRTARSIVDYVVRWMGNKFLDLDEISRSQLGLKPLEPKESVEDTEDAAPIPGGEIAPRRDVHAATRPAERPKLEIAKPTAVCTSCGSANLQRTGSCFTCVSCGSTTGCG